MLLRAAGFAAHKHRDQRRKGVAATPYINHPIAVANVLANEAGITDPVVLSAALLHDTIEDTETSQAELVAEFGPTIGSVVAEVTDDKRLPKAERKRLQIEHAAHVSYEAKLVKIADKICNVRDMVTAPPDWPIERKHEYSEWAGRVVDQMRGTHAKLEELFDAAFVQGQTSLPK
jgi:guanosine-3',5'-bis(diphosphate) 3'-pyrophosphohydrolase